MHTPITLTIAGSDSGGGAGIQADIKAISATRGYACSVITALTAQNTLGVSGICPVAPDFVAQQLDAVFSDLQVQAVKIGMLADSDIIAVVAAKLRQYRPAWVVLDPVMVATSGDLLLENSAISSLTSQLLPLANIITPNLPEAAQLLGMQVPESDTEVEQMIIACQKLLMTLSSEVDNPQILLKGGHLHGKDTSCDWLIGRDSVSCLQAPRINTLNTHGTGCSLSAAIASFLAQGQTMPEAVAQAKSYLTEAIAHADLLKVGRGHGPVNHFYHLMAIQGQ